LQNKCIAFAVKQKVNTGDCMVWSTIDIWSESNQTRHPWHISF